MLLGVFSVLELLYFQLSVVLFQTNQYVYSSHPSFSVPAQANSPFARLLHRQFFQFLFIPRGHLFFLEVHLTFFFNILPFSWQQLPSYLCPLSLCCHSCRHSTSSVEEYSDPRVLPQQFDALIIINENNYHLTYAMILCMTYLIPSPVFALVSKYGHDFSFATFYASNPFLASVLFPTTKIEFEELSLASLTQKSILSIVVLLDRSQKTRTTSAYLQNQFRRSAKSSFPLKSQIVTWVTKPPFSMYLSPVSTPRVGTQLCANSPLMYCFMKADFPVRVSPTNATLTCLVCF